MHPFTLPQEASIVQLLNPATDAAGRTGAYVTCKHAHKAYIVVHITQGNAATIALTINQAKTVAGGSAKAITVPVRIWADLDESVTDALVEQAAAVSFTTDAGVKNKIVVFEVNPAEFDVANGFDCVTVVTGASNVANITAAQAILTPLRFGAPTPPSAVVD